MTQMCNNFELHDMILAADISKGAKNVAMYLWNRADHKTGTAWPSVATISRGTAMSERSVQYALRELERAGFIRTSRPTAKIPATLRYHRGDRLPNIYAVAQPSRGATECTPSNPHEVQPIAPRSAPQECHGVQPVAPKPPIEYKNCANLKVCLWDANETQFGFNTPTSRPTAPSKYRKNPSTEIRTEPDLPSPHLASTTASRNRATIAAANGVASGAGGLGTDTPEVGSGPRTAIQGELWAPTECDRKAATRPRRVSAHQAMMEAVCEIFGLEPATTTDHKRVSALARDFLLHGATIAELGKRAERYKIAWPTMEATPNALLNNWETFGDEKWSKRNGKSGHPSGMLSRAGASDEKIERYRLIGLGGR